MEYDGDTGAAELQKAIMVAALEVASLERQLRTAQKKLAKLESIKLEKTGIFVYERNPCCEVKLTDFD